MSLAEIPDEEFIAEFQRRVDRGGTAWARVLPHYQQDFRYMWELLTQWVADERNGGKFDHYAELQSKINEIADSHTPPAFTYTAVNTTLYGREDQSEPKES